MSTVSDGMDFSTLLVGVLEQAEVIKKAGRRCKDCKVYNFKCDMVDGKLHSSWTIRRNDGIDMLYVTCVAPDEHPNHVQKLKMFDVSDDEEKIDKKPKTDKKRKANDKARTKKRKTESTPMGQPTENIQLEPKVSDAVIRQRDDETIAQQRDDSSDVEEVIEKQSSPLIYDLE